MSFPDPPPTPYQFILPPFAGIEHVGFWPPYLNENVESDLLSPYDVHPPPPKRTRNSEKPFPPRVNPPNPTGSKGTSHIFYKTRICARFMEGLCRNGESCTFAHGPEDLHEPPPNWQELVGETDRCYGNGGWGDDQRRINRMKTCKKYYNGEECPYGEKCIYLHERPPRPLPNFEDDIPRQRESSAISIGTTGMETKDNSRYFDQSDRIKVTGGSDNQSRMVFWKTRLCSKWEMGLCPFREKCHYAHGESELKVSGTRIEAERATNSSVPILKTPLSASVFSPAPATLAVGALQGDDGEDQKNSKWKLTKKINRIYADWLDDRTPPHYSPNQEEI